MPILASRGREIRELLEALSEPKKREGALLRLRNLGPRVVPHAGDDLARLGPEARRGLLEILRDVQTADARALKKRLARVDTGGPGSPRPAPPEKADPEAQALDDLRALPPPRPDERASISRERGEAHLALARAGSRLARKDLLLSLNTLAADRSRLYWEAAGLIGDTAFLAPLARVALVRPEAAHALAKIVKRERITAKSRILRELEDPLRPIVARAILNR